jgi:hypothetical protein
MTPRGGEIGRTTKQRGTLPLLPLLAPLLLLPLLPMLRWLSASLRVPSSRLLSGARTSVSW